MSQGHHVEVRNSEALRPTAAMILLSAVGGALLFFFSRSTSVWGIALALLGYLSAFAIDGFLAWQGSSVRFSKLALSVLVFAHSTFGYVTALLLGRSLDEAFAVAFGATIVVGLLAGFETTYTQARTVLRVLKGLRESGSFETGMAGAVVPELLSQSFATGILEARLRQELETTVESETSPTLVPREKTDLDFGILRIGQTRVLFRIEGPLVECLYVPIDGVVARFELAEKQALRARFVLEQILHFNKPEPKSAERIRLDLEGLYRQFAAPTFDFRALRKSIAEIWRIRRQAILASLISFVLVALGFVAVLNVNPIVAWLSRADVNTALASLGYIGAIVTGVVVGLRWLAERGRRKSPK